MNFPTEPQDTEHLFYRCKVGPSSVKNFLETLFLLRHGQCSPGDRQDFLAIRRFKIQFLLLFFFRSVITHWWQPVRPEIIKERNRVFYKKPRNTISLPYNLLVLENNYSSRLPPPPRLHTSLIINVQSPLNLRKTLVRWGCSRLL